ncbi:hypothetical protein R6Q57_013029 [Mikania cordata]
MAKVANTDSVGFEPSFTRFRVLNRIGNQLFSYVGVGENEDVQLFYYFIQSESDPNHDPLMLWITGGPGCSSISGLIYEIGPMQFEAMDYNGSFPNLILKPYSWTKMTSIIFLDVPVGSGFSYAKTAFASHSTDIQLCDQAYEFMRKWFKSHPEFLSNPFYIGGDSYSGLPIPIITQLISDGNICLYKRIIVDFGYLLGNPLTFPEEDNFKIRFSNGMGIISDDLYKCIYGIQEPHVLEPYCGHVWLIKLPTQKLLKDHTRLSSVKCRNNGYKLVYYWINNASVQEALHVRKLSQAFPKETIFRRFDPALKADHSSPTWICFLGYPFSLGLSFPFPFLLRFLSFFLITRLCYLQLMPMGWRLLVSLHRLNRCRTDMETGNSPVPRDFYSTTTGIVRNLIPGFSNRNQQ